MSIRVTSAFSKRSTARQAALELVEAGCEEDDVTIIESNGKSEEVAGRLSDLGFSKDEIGKYVEAVGEGRTLLTVSIDEERSDEAKDILEKHEQEETEGSPKRQQASGGTKREGETMPIVEERMTVGKEAEQQSVRVERRVSEKPVEKTVHLESERVDVERRPADRAASPDEAAEAFKETTREFEETEERATVGKEARVVGEVNLRKASQGREEKVKDTVRRTEVEVERGEAKHEKEK